MSRWLLALSALPALAQPYDVAVIVSANAEWREVRKHYPSARYESSPLGEYFLHRNAVVFHGGWGKIAAAASAQYVIDRWKPRAILNLGTCGGIAGAIEKHAVILATKTIVYDIVEQMGDAQAALDFYTTDLDPAWLGDSLPLAVRQATLLSADRDLVAKDIPGLRKKYDALAVDWESGAIAWVAKRNGVRAVVVRGVSDLVSARGGEAYGKMQVFESGTAVVMRKLLAGLEAWIELLERRAK